eukprot:TRINITY_DN3251_c0_g1_i3.p1 TRINITY_DN3251_c0_g1~~TRINITY_DN3251_c0_g1_i3.p1  ORF type:complete len:565 (-),score=131.48 TRINITY_DN3251_c0_g1_i3:40-1632(-)
MVTDLMQDPETERPQTETKDDVETAPATPSPSEGGEQTNEEKKTTALRTRKDDKETVEEEEEEVGAALFNAIDTGVDALSLGAGFLGSMLQRGLERVQTTTAQLPMGASVEAVMGVGHNIATQGVDALEAVGKRAMDLIAANEKEFKEKMEKEEAKDGEQQSSSASPLSNTASSSQSETSTSSPQLSSTQTSTIASSSEPAPSVHQVWEADDYKDDLADLKSFDMNDVLESLGGKEWSSHIEPLSVAATAKVHQRMRAKEADKPRSIVSQVQELFDQALEPTDDDAASSDDPSVPSALTEPYQTYTKALQSSMSTVSDVDTYKADTKDKNTEGRVQALEQLTLQGLKQLARTTVRATHILLLLAQANVPSSQVLPFAKRMQADLTSLSNAIIEALRSLSAELATDDHKQAVEGKSSACINTVCLDTDAAQSSLSDNIKLLIPLCQLAEIDAPDTSSPSSDSSSSSSAAPEAKSTEEAPSETSSDPPAASEDATAEAPVEDSAADADAEASSEAKPEKSSGSKKKGRRGKK